MYETRVCIESIEKCAAPFSASKSRCFALKTKVSEFLSLPTSRNQVPHRSTTTMKIFEEAVEIAIANGWKYPVQIETLPTEFIMKDWKDYEITGKVYVLVGDIFGQGVVAVYMIGGISKEAIIMTKYGILKRKCDILNNDWQYLAIESLEAYLSSIEAALVKLEGLATGMNLQFLAQQAILRSKTYFLDDKKLSSLVEIYEKFQKSCSNVSNCDVYLPTDINPQALDVIKCQLGQPFDVFNYPNYDSCSFVQHLGLQMIKIEKDQEPVISPLKSKAIDMQKVIGSCKGIIKKQMDTLSHMELLKRYFLDPIRENYQRLGFTKEHLVSIQHPSVDSMIKCLRKFSIELGQNEDPGYVVKCFLANSAQLAKSTKDYSIAYASADLTKGIYGNGIELDRFIIECQNLMERETAQPLQYNDLRIKPVQYFVHMTMAMKEIFEYCDPAIQPLELLREGFIVSKNISEDNDKHVGNILRQTYMPRLISCISGLASLRTGNLLINSVEADEILTGKSGWLTLFSTCIVFIVEKPATRMFNTKLVFQLDEFSTSILDASGTNVILFKDEQLFNFTIKESQSRKDEFVKQMQHFAETCDTKVRDNRSDILCCNELETDFYFDIYSNASKIQRKKSDSAILVFDREPFDLMNLRGRYDNILLLMVSGKQTAKLAILSESDLMNSNEDLEFHENTIESCFYKLKTFLKQYSNKKSAKLGRLSYWDEMRLGGLIRLLIHGNDVFAMRNLVISRRSSVSYQVACLEGKAHGRAGSTLSRFSLISSKSKQTMESIMDHIAAPIRKLKGDTSSSIYTNEKPPSRSRKFASMMRSVLSTTSIDSINQIIEVLIKRKNEIEQFQKFKISPLHVNVIEDIASCIFSLNSNQKAKKRLKEYSERFTVTHSAGQHTDFLG